MKLTSADNAKISFALEHIYALQDLDGFMATAMQVLPQLVDSYMLSYNEVNYEARRMFSVLNSPVGMKYLGEKEPELISRLEQNPLIEHSSKVRDAPTKISDFITQDEWRNREVYKKFYGPLRVNYQMALVLPLDTPVIIAFAFNRIDRDFSERDRAILAALQPHLTLAYRNSELYTQTVDRMKSREEMLEAVGAGWIDLSRDLLITNTASSARETLRLFFKDNYLDDDRLPPEVENWIATQSEPSPGTPPAPMMVENNKGRLTLRLFTAPGTNAQSIVVERFLRAKSPKPLESLGLTKRQAECLYWMGQGKSNTEIAIILKIGARTVENHAYRIFEILGVNNRTEAATLAMSYLTGRG